MESEFNNYFNKTLKNYLQYPETFSITFSQGKITLLPSQSSDLLNLIKTDVNLKTNLLKQLESLLNKHYPNRVEDFYLSSHGTDIVVNYKLIPQLLPNKTYYQLKPQRIEVLFTELYSVIFSYTNPNDLQKFEDITEFKNITRDPKFWIVLVNNKFGKYLRSSEKINDYRDFYFGMSDYESLNPEIKNIYVYFQLLKDVLANYYPQVMAYLIKTDQVYVIPIGLKINPDWENMKLDLVYSTDDPELLEYFYKYKIKYFEEYDNSLRRKNLRPKIFDYLFARSGHGYNFKNLSEALILAADRSNEDLVDHILNRLPKNPSKEELYQFFSIAAQSGLTRTTILTSFWNKYKHLFNSREIKELNKLTKSNFMFSQSGLIYI